VSGGSSRRGLSVNGQGLLAATAGGWVVVELDVRLYLRDEITTQRMVNLRVRLGVGGSPPAPGTVHGRGPRRVLGPDRGRLAFRRSPARLVQDLTGQPVARAGEVGAGGGPRLRGAH